MVQRANNQLRSLRVERSGDTVTATIKGSRGNGLQATGSVIILSLILALFTYGFGLLLIPLGIWFFAFARTKVVFSNDGVVTVGGKKLSIEDIKGGLAEFLKNPEYAKRLEDEDGSSFMLYT